MALSDTITSLGTSIINLVGTRAKTDLSNITSAGETVISNLASGVPVGTVIAYMGSSAPSGFLLMDGRTVSRTTYADLFAVVGTSMGAGDGSTTFGIADMTDGRYLMGSTVAGSSYWEVEASKYQSGGYSYNGTWNNYTPMSTSLPSSGSFSYRYIIGEERNSYKLTFALYQYSNGNWSYLDIWNNSYSSGLSSYLGQIHIYKNGTELFRIINNSEFQNFKPEQPATVSAGDIIDIYCFSHKTIKYTTVILKLKYDYETIYINTSTPAPTWCYIKY